MRDFVDAATGNDYDMPIFDLYESTTGVNSLLHLRALPRFHIQNSAVNCSTLSWHVEGVVLTTPPTETPTQTPTYTPTRSPTAVPTSRSTPIGQSSLVSHVTWQGPPAQPSAGQQLPITLTLCASGAPVVYTATTDADGYFTITTTLPPGSYNWWVKGPKYLATSGALTLASGTNAEMAWQRAGDIDSTHDNLDSIKDFTTMRSVMGTASTEGDLNNDGVTNITDYGLMRSNFGASGDSANCQ